MSKLARPLSPPALAKPASRWGAIISNLVGLMQKGNMPSATSALVLIPAGAMVPV